MLASSRLKAERRIAAPAVLVIAIALSGVNPLPAYAVPPAMGGRVLGIQASEAENQTSSAALDMVAGSGSTSQSIHTYWSDFEPTPQSYDFSFIDDLWATYDGTDTTIKLRIDPIYTCSRTVPSDLANTDWDDAEMIERFETILDGVYDASHPVGETPLNLDVLIVGTEVSSALKLLGTDASDKDYYAKYVTFFDTVRTYAKSLWGNSLVVSSSSTWGKLVSDSPQTFSNDGNNVSASSTTMTFTSSPWGIGNGDYVTIDYAGTHPEVRKVVSGAGTSSWTLDAPLGYAHTATYTVVRTTANSIQTLNATADVVFYSYYGIDENTLTAKDPYTAPYLDIYEAATHYPTRTMGILEAGYPSSPNIGGSETLQDAFVSSIWGAWDQYCDDASCENPSLKYVDFQWATDWNEANVIQFAIEGCNGNSPPIVSTSTTNSAASGQSQITFTSAPSYFSNGDTVYLVGSEPFSGIEEKAVIASGAGTTTWTLTGNLANAHSAGYTVLWKAPTKPWAGVYGATGSTIRGYRISAVNANGETIRSDEFQVTNGPATLSGSNFIWLVWNTVPGAASYNVYRTTAGGTPSTTGYIGNVSTNTFNDTGVTTSAHTAFTENLFHFLWSLGYRAWAGSGTDKLAWDTMCDAANIRGVTTTNC